MPVNAEETLNRYRILVVNGLMTEEVFESHKMALQGNNAIGNMPTTEESYRSKAARLAPFDPPPGLLTAPYRFVGLNSIVAMPPFEFKSFDHSKRLPGGYSAEIEVTFECETPLLVGGSEQQSGAAMPMSLGSAVTKAGATEQKNKNAAKPLAPSESGPWWVPGSSLRGLLRAAAECVAFGRLEQTNRSYVFPLRNFTHDDYNGKPGPDGKRDKPSLGDAKSVGVGWLKKESDEWYIYQSSYCYVPLSEVAQRYCNGDEPLWLSTKLAEKYWLAEDRHLTFSKPVKLTTTHNSKKDHDQGTFSTSGVDWILVFSGVSPPPGQGVGPKQWEYAAKPFDPAASKMRISKADWERFEVMATTPGRADKREPVGSWIELSRRVEAGGHIPVFYTRNISLLFPDSTEIDPAFAFGLTRLFKLPHHFSQGEMLDREPAHKMPLGSYVPDMVSALFGYVIQTKEGAEYDAALKGRIAVSGATITDAVAHVQPSDALEAVMAQPRASFAPFYLVGSKKDWTDVAEDTRIAGRKRYLPSTIPNPNENMRTFLDIARKRMADQRSILTGLARGNIRNLSKMKFLMGVDNKPFCFTHRISLRNVHAAELGLILWILTFGGHDRVNTYRHVLGRAKAYGLGQLRVKEVTFAHLEPNVATLTLPTIKDFIAAFETHMVQQGVNDFAKHELIQQFLASCDPKVGAGLARADAETTDLPPKAVKTLYLPLKDHSKIRGAPHQVHAQKIFLKI